MDQELELRLVSGGEVKITLPSPGEFASFYVLSLEYSGSMQFWHLLERLMAAVGYPLLAFSQGLRQHGRNFEDLVPNDRYRLLSQRGYGLGVLFDPEPALHNPAVVAAQKLLFIRDPRDMILTQYLRQQAEAADAGAPPSASLHEFLGSSQVERVVQRYRRFADLRRKTRSVSLLRYETTLTGWYGIAADLLTALDLPLAPSIAAGIAAAVPPVGDRLPSQYYQPGGAAKPGIDDLSTRDVVALEARFADVLPVFGYAPRVATSRASAAPQGSVTPRESELATSELPQDATTAPRNAQGWLRPIGLTEFDPVLHSRLKPNARAEMQILGRRVIMDVDEFGCRPVIDQPAIGDKMVAIYGCSFTYGTAVSAEETFCSLLQGQLPAWRVENHGVPGYSASRNLIQLQRATRWNQADLVTFCWISDHLRRNVCDIQWIQLISANRMVSRLQSKSAALTGRNLQATEQLPRAALDAEGRLAMRSVRMPREDIIGVDFTDFNPDPFYLDLVCFRLFERANAVVTAYGGHFFVTMLEGRFSPTLAGRLAEARIPVVDASLAGKDYRCLPDDPHPNALAHRIHAERIADYLMRTFAVPPPAA